MAAGHYTLEDFLQFASGRHMNKIAKRHVEHCRTCQRIQKNVREIIAAGKNYLMLFVILLLSEVA